MQSQVAPPPHRLTVRSGSLADFDQVMAIEAESFPPLDAYTEDYMRKRVAEFPAGFLVAARDRDVLGYILVDVLGPTLHVSSMAVAGPVRHEGIGTRLLHAALDKFSNYGLRLVSLEVSARNTLAISLYRRFGFRLVEQLPAYYDSDGSDALVMERPLRDESTSRQ
jgi:ribosomal-protein-alanine N-acetyltransferase